MIWGDVFFTEVKGNFRKIYTVSITDYTGSINLKIRAQEGEDCSKWESIPKGTTVVVRGDCSYDKYEHDYIVWPYDVLFVERKKREDNAPVKRVELHLHTKLSSMDAFCDPGGIVKLAHRMGHPAIAITDHGVCQGYPEAMLATDAIHETDPNFKLIYGCEAYFVDDMIPAVYGNAQMELPGNFVVFDTETTGLDLFNDRIVGLSLAVEPHRAWYVPFTPGVEAEYAAIIRPLFESEQIAKIGQNIKFDLMVLRRLGVALRGRLYDTMILHYLLDPESRHNMNALAERYLNYRPIEIETLIGRGARQLTMDQVAVTRVAEYAAEDADITLQLKQCLWPEVVREGLQHLYAEIEEPMIAVLADIETAGVRIDTAALADYAVELRERLATLEQEIRTLAEEPALNINSTRQLDEEYLQGFAGKYRIVSAVLEYRGVKKLLSTYVEALPQLVNPRTGRIHTSFNQAVTATGRLSSTNPNLQNIPVRDELGRRIRRAFIPSDDDHLLLSADYSQVELRLMAHLSGDESLIAAFEHGEDIHAATAARLFHKELDEVTPEERRRAKTANFGIIYGISAFGLSQRLEIPRKEARELIEGYFATYPGVKAYMERVVGQARRDGFVSTIFGRRRYLNDINSRNAVARGLAERNAVNAPIQGSAADIMKIAMIEVSRRFAAEGIRSKVILQVHDELVVDLLREEQERVTRIVTEAMESAARLRVRLVVECGVGKNWLEAH